MATKRTSGITGKSAVGPSGVAAGSAQRASAATATAERSSRKITQEMIARRAYQLYVARGRVDGFAEQDWRQAERELRAQASQG